MGKDKPHPRTHTNNPPLPTTLNKTKGENPTSEQQSAAHERVAYSSFYIRPRLSPLAENTPASVHS